MVNPRERPITPLASSIDVLRRQFGLGRPSSLATVAARWGEAVGEAAAASTTVIDLRGGVLTVEAVDPAAAEVIRWSEARIVDAVRAWCPEDPVAQVRVRVRRR